MPMKRRAQKGRRYRISPEAAARWREVRPHGLYFGGGGPGRLPADFIDDQELGELLGRPALLAMAPGDAQELYDELEEAIGCP